MTKSKRDNINLNLITKTMDLLKKKYLLQYSLSDCNILQQQAHFIFECDRQPEIKINVFYNDNVIQYSIRIGCCIKYHYIPIFWKCSEIVDRIIDDLEKDFQEMYNF